MREAEAAVTKYLAPAQLSTKTEAVYRRLRDAIVAGELDPGERLDQKSIADTLGVSMMPLRQALMRLAAHHLVELRPHHGAVVAPLTVEGFDELYAMRAALETMVAGRAAVRVTPDVVIELQDLYKLQVDAVKGGRYSEYVELDRRFHRAIYDCAGMARASDLIEDLRDASDRYVRRYVAYRQRGSQSLKEHVSLIEAASSRDEQKLRRLTQQHVLGASKDLLGIIAESNSGASASRARETGTGNAS